MARSRSRSAPVGKLAPARRSHYQCGICHKKIDDATWQEWEVVEDDNPDRINLLEPTYEDNVEPGKKWAVVCQTCKLMMMISTMMRM